MINASFKFLLIGAMGVLGCTAQAQRTVPPEKLQLATARLDSALSRLDAFWTREEFSASSQEDILALMDLALFNEAFNRPFTLPRQGNWGLSYRELEELYRYRYDRSFAGKIVLSVTPEVEAYLQDLGAQLFYTQAIRDAAAQFCAQRPPVPNHLQVLDTIFRSGPTGAVAVAYSFTTPQFRSCYEGTALFDTLDAHLWPTLAAISHNSGENLWPQGAVSRNTTGYSPFVHLQDRAGATAYLLYTRRFSEIDPRVVFQLVTEQKTDGGWDANPMSKGITEIQLALYATWVLLEVEANLKELPGVVELLSEGE